VAIEKPAIPIPAATMNPKAHRPRRMIEFCCFGDVPSLSVMRFSWMQACILDAAARSSCELVHRREKIERFSVNWFTHPCAIRPEGG
jgi:hypothetical protein